MDKILSSILCCSFGSKPEHKSSTSSTSSSRNTAESNKRADLKKLDQNDDIDEVGNVSIDKMKSSNAQTIILQPVANNIDQKDSQTKTSSSYPSTPVTPVTPNSNSNSNPNPNNANGNVNANQRQQNEASYAHDNDVKNNEPYQNQANINNDANIAPNGNGNGNGNGNDNNGDQDVDNLQSSSSNASEYDGQEYIDESQFDLTTMQPDQVVASTGWLLEAPDKKYKNKKCLVLDLDETLVHSSFKYLRSADFVIPVEIEGQIHNVYVIKRPGVDEFMKRVGELYEVVVFTASVSRYGDPLLDELDIHKSVHHRLFRDSCYNYQGNYIKNLSQIGRPLSDLIIIDNSPASYIFHPQHAVPISSWFSDAHDNELLDILPFLEDLAKQDVDDVSLVLDVTT